MSFKEYFKNELSEDLFSEYIIEDGIIRTLTSPLRAVGGAATNLLYQTGRGGIRTARGLGKGFRGLGKAGLGALQTISGDPSRGIKTALSGAGDILSGAGDVVAGGVQAAASPLSSVVRGVQAAGEPMSVKSFDPQTSGLQKFFGLSSWRTPEEQAAGKRDEFDKLMAMGNAAKTKQERDEIRRKLSQLDPERYDRLLKRAQAKAAARARALPTSVSPVSDTASA